MIVHSSAQNTLLIGVLLNPEGPLIAIKRLTNQFVQCISSNGLIKVSFELLYNILGVIASLAFTFTLSKIDKTKFI